MSAASTFFDTNVLLYMLSNDLAKSARFYKQKTCSMVSCLLDVSG
jgi:predicted nucleic acid-binding protein